MATDRDVNSLSDLESFDFTKTGDADFALYGQLVQPGSTPADTFNWASFPNEDFVRQVRIVLVYDLPAGPGTRAPGLLTLSELSMSLSAFRRAGHR